MFDMNNDVAVCCLKFCQVRTEWVNCREKFDRLSGEEIGWHVDTFFILDSEVVIQHGQLKSVQCFGMQVTRVFRGVCGRYTEQIFIL